MTEQTKELVTKVDVQPDLTGLLAFEKEIGRAISKVNQLDTAIKKVGELRPVTRYSPPVSNPGATAAAAGLSAGLGANLVNRGTLGPLVRKASEDVAKNAAQTAATGVNLAIEDMRGRMVAGRGLVSFMGAGAGGGFTAQAGGGGGVMSRPRAFDGMNFGADNFNGVPMEKKPVADAVGRATGQGFKMPDMMAGAAAAVGLSMGLDAVAQSMDRIQSKEAQLARLPQTLTDSKTAFIALNEAATEVRSGGDAFISTYANMATATEKLHLSQEETIKSAQGMVSALQLGGGSKVAIDNALYQMGQAFSSNRFGGDEFRSFMEAIGTQAPEVAKAFGTDVAGLRKMSEEGKLTAETMTKAFASMADKNMDLLNKQGWTWGQVTTVMKNDWDIFLASATEGGEWARLMSWVSQNIVPGFRSAEKAVAQFWSTTTDESKASILIGILGAIGAAFAALAIPVLAATWPFLAVGAAVFLLYELFQEFKHWMDGSAKTIFDNLFGSFDEFEKRYPNIVKGLSSIMQSLSGVTDKFTEMSKAKSESLTGMDPKVQSKLDEAYKLQTNPLEGTKYLMDGLDWLLGLGSDDSKPTAAATGLTPPGVRSSSQTTISNTNSSNTTITVATPEEAATVANNRDKSFVSQNNGSLDNMAEGGGYV
ncbi:tape measure protein [Buttiauxella sp. B2]|uniref:tape measure protein n=1 Tax=Buttiauxella sp. B2 TaxID=2587812 RepID=UPI00111FF52D|nr:tape measure protein [Buttiauxella sp. B2]TNV17882.1 tape measure protein [Buttiauxella sp. B2]